jgi:CubicO group peptidase (beta-lactamase class C family)
MPCGSGSSGGIYKNPAMALGAFSPVRAAVLGLLLGAIACMIGCSRPRGGGIVEEREAGFSTGTWARMDRLASTQTGSAADFDHGVIVVTGLAGQLYRRSFGSQETAMDRRFDVASLAKPIAGVPAAGLILKPGPTSAADPLAEFSRHRSIVPNLLGHTSGLDDDIDYPATLAAARALVSRPEGYLRVAAPMQLAEPLILRAENRPAEPCRLYSNSAYILLSFLASSETGEVESILHDQVWQPCGMDSTGYRRMGGEARAFDPMADLMLDSGIAIPLHSGLMSTADDVARFPIALGRQDTPSKEFRAVRDTLFGRVAKLRECETGSTIYASAAGIVSPITTPYARQGSPLGRFFIATGYTGCLLWYDSETNTSMAILTDAAQSDALGAWNPFAEQAAQILVNGQMRGLH